MRTEAKEFRKAGGRSGRLRSKIPQVEFTEESIAQLCFWYFWRQKYKEKLIKQNQNKFNGNAALKSSEIP